MYGKRNETGMLMWGRGTVRNPDTELQCYSHLLPNRFNAAQSYLIVLSNALSDSSHSLLVAQEVPQSIRCHYHESYGEGDGKRYEYLEASEAQRCCGY